MKNIIPLIVLVILLITGVYYWQKKSQDDISNQSVPQAPSKATSITLEGTGDYNTSGDVSNQDVITSGDVYTYTLSEIRKPVNEAIYDLIDRYKYQNKYSKEDVLSAAKTAKDKCIEGKEKIKNLQIDVKFEPFNQKHIQSVEYLIESINALEKFYETGETKYVDEFSLNIDHSNREINNLNIPQ